MVARGGSARRLGASRRDGEARVGWSGFGDGGSSSSQGLDLAPPRPEAPSSVAPDYDSWNRHHAADDAEDLDPIQAAMAAKARREREAAANGGALGHLLAGYGDASDDETRDASDAPADAPVAPWAKLRDDASGHDYYWNKDTGAVVWTLAETRADTSTADATREGPVVPTGSARSSRARAMTSLAARARTVPGVADAVDALAPVVRLVVEFEARARGLGLAAEDGEGDDAGSDEKRLDAAIARWLADGETETETEGAPASAGAPPPGKIAGVGLGARRAAPNPDASAPNDASAPHDTAPSPPPLPDEAPPEPPPPPPHVVSAPPTRRAEASAEDVFFRARVAFAFAFDSENGDSPRARHLAETRGRGASSMERGEGGARGGGGGGGRRG